MSNLYTAFLSSNFSSLKDIREKVTSCFLDNNIFPVAMEHFVVDANNGFKNIMKLIDGADMFILIMGTKYGSRDTNDDARASWTEKEYKYAIETHKSNMLVIVLQELADMVDNNVDKMSDEELEKLYPFQSAEDTRSQIAFAREVRGKSFAKEVSVDYIYNSINQFVQNGINNKLFVGWSRNVSDEEIAKCIKPGIYYHCHISSTQVDYLRIGQVEVKRGDSGYGLEFVNGINYKAKVIETADGQYEIIFDDMQYTMWHGRYILDVSGSTKIEGRYRARRIDVDTNGDKKISAGERDGIHSFTKVATVGKYGNILHGRSQDAITDGLDGKECIIEMFETEQGRDQYLIDRFIKRNKYGL